MLWSSTAILAPLAAIARAVAAPRPEPPPVMRTATSFSCISGLLGRFLLMGEWRIGSSEWGQITPYSLLPIRYSLSFFHHSTADQRFHVLDVVTADSVGDGTDAGGARHRMAAEKQVIAGADQACVEQDRIDISELARLDALRQQPAVKVQQRRNEEFR